MALPKLDGADDGEGGPDDPDPLDTDAEELI